MFVPYHFKNGVNFSLILATLRFSSSDLQPVRLRTTFSYVFGSLDYLIAFTNHITQWKIAKNSPLLSFYMCSEIVGAPHQLARNNI